MRTDTLEQIMRTHARATFWLGFAIGFFLGASAILADFFVLGAP